MGNYVCLLHVWIQNLSSELGWENGYFIRKILAICGQESYSSAAVYLLICLDPGNVYNLLTRRQWVSSARYNRCVDSQEILFSWLVLYYVGY